MKQSISLKTLATGMSSIFKRHHVVLFVLTVVVGVSVAMFLLYNLINTTTDKEVIATTSSAIFDEETIEKINKLAPSDSTHQELALPDGRINPFVE